MRCVSHASFTDSEFSSQEDVFQFLNFFTSQRQSAFAHLEPVMRRHWKVTCGDHHASINGKRPAGMVDATCGNDAQVMHFYATLDEASNQFSGQCRRGITNIPPNSKRIALKIGRHSASEPISERGG